MRTKIKDEGTADTLTSLAIPCKVCDESISFHLELRPQPFPICDNCLTAMMTVVTQKRMEKMIEKQLPWTHPVEIKSFTINIDNSEHQKPSNEK